MRLTGRPILFVVAALCSVGSACARVTQRARLRPIAMNDLTVPQNHLPAGCSLSSREAVVAATRGQGGEDRPTIVNIPSNPWTGTDPSKIADIRGRLAASSRLLPDPPPPVSPELLAQGIEDAYIAIYSNQSDLTKPIVVYALRFADNTRPFYPPSIHRFEIGPINGIVSGGDGPCSQVVEAYLKSLAK